MVADDFIRELYRRGRLNATEMESRLSALAALQRGEHGRVDGLGGL